VCGPAAVRPTSARPWQQQPSPQRSSSPPPRRMRRLADSGSGQAFQPQQELQLHEALVGAVMASCGGSSAAEGAAAGAASTAPEAPVGPAWQLEQLAARVALVRRKHAAAAEAEEGGDEELPAVSGWRQGTLRRRCWAACASWRLSEPRSCGRWRGWRRRGRTARLATRRCCARLRVSEECVHAAAAPHMPLALLLPRSLPPPPGHTPCHVTPSPLPSQRL
jgi:hypothetical protein